MHPLLTRWMSRSPSLFGSRGTAPAAVLPHAVARRESGRGKRLAPVIRRLDIATASAFGALSAVGMRGIDVSPPERVSLRIDPSDQRRTRISGRMGDVCDALDALVRLQQA
jgi:hypothetical protein